MLLEIIGWIGSILFCFSAAPQCIHTWKTNETSGLTWGLLSMWFFGELFCFIFVLGTNIQSGMFQWPLLANYTINFIMLCYLIYKKFVGEVLK